VKTIERPNPSNDLVMDLRNVPAGVYTLVDDAGNAARVMKQ
jgi:hypothetical protein